VLFSRVCKKNKHLWAQAVQEASRHHEPMTLLKTTSNLLCLQNRKTDKKPNHPPGAQGALMTMPSPPAYRPLSLVLITIFLTLYLPHSTHAAFNEAACLSCIGTDDSSLNATEFASVNLNYTYCEVGVVGTGTYQCIPSGNNVTSNLCNDAIPYFFDFQCNGDLDDVIKAAKGIAIGFIILIIVCCLAITGGIAACVYCCVRSGNNNNNNRGAPGGQYPPAPQQQQQQQPMLVLPGTIMEKTTATSLPAQTGLTTEETPYQPSSYDSNNNKV
jgi:hypothetical protein